MKTILNLPIQPIRSPRGVPTGDRRPLKTSALALLAALTLGTPFVTPARAEVDIDFFYSSLGDQGDWIEVDDYGYAWQPRGVSATWAPYSDGSWAHTEAGWTWVSDEPYGWAVYHYGRWTRLEGRGWAWVPGREWGPAWVSWRKSDDYVGWAPLPPESQVTVGVSIGGWVDAAFDIGPRAYTFVPFRQFGAARISDVIVEREQNVTIINRTTNITNITYNNNTYVNRGLDYDDVSRRVERAPRRLKLEREVNIAATGDRAALRSSVQGDTFKVPSPQVRGEGRGKPARIAARAERAQIDRGWKDAGSQEDVAKLRAKVKAEAPVPKEITAKLKAPRENAEREQPANPTATVQDPAAPKPGDAARPQKVKPGQDRPNVGTPQDSANPPKPDAPNQPQQDADRPNPKKPAEDPLRQRDPKADEPQSQEPDRNRAQRPGEQRPDRPRPNQKEEAQKDVSQPAQREEMRERQRGNQPETPRPNTPDRPNAERPDRAEKAEGADRRAQAGRPERPERPDRADRPEKAESPDRPNLPERPAENRPDRPAAAEQPRRPQADGAARPERPNRQEAAPNRPEAQPKKPKPNAEEEGVEKDKKKDERQ